jgi:hypothetical protein
VVMENSIKARSRSVPQSRIHLIFHGDAMKRSPMGTGKPIIAVFDTKPYDRDYNVTG